MHGPAGASPRLDAVGANAHTGDMSNVTYRAPRGHTELIKRAAKAAGVKGYTTFIREAAERVAREVLDEAERRQRLCTVAPSLGPNLLQSGARLRVAALLELQPRQRHRQPQLRVDQVVWTPPAGET